LPPKALVGKLVVISRGGRGIGRAMARALAWEGAAVIIAEIADSGAETEQLVTAEGGRVQFIRTDVSDEGSVTVQACQVSAGFGPVDILINNAILCPAGGVLEMDVAVWDRVMAVNLRGTFLMCRAFLPQMLARAQGTIINMISLDGLPYLSA
jgi:NAD(P)-dependent dehydrogenase (short-subunit alcohol dehydrogenase family)